MTTCRNCLEPISHEFISEEIITLLCSECKSRFHGDCVGITSKFFYNLIQKYFQNNFGQAIKIKSYKNSLTVRIHHTPSVVEVMELWMVKVLLSIPLLRSIV